MTERIWRGTVENKIKLSEMIGNNSIALTQLHKEKLSPKNMAKYQNRNFEGL